MITEETYLELKKLLSDYENNRINLIIDDTQPYLTQTTINTDLIYNPKYGNNRVCKCGHVYYRHFDSYEHMYAIGCKYCQCYKFEEKE